MSEKKGLGGRSSWRSFVVAESARGPAWLLLAALSIQLGWMLAVNGGQLVFSIDDAYIHLALAENISVGHFGVNPTEASAPSSSIVWPLLLTPFASTPLGPWSVLVGNAVFAVLSLCVIARIASIALEPGEDPQRHALRAGVLLLAIPLTNLVALVFQGMEHVLQLFVCTAVVLGLVLDAREERVPGWLWVAIVAAPLVRYECVSVSGGALILLFARGHRVAAFTTGSVLLALIVGHAAYLQSLALGPLPTSVVAKAGLSGELGWLVTRWLDNLGRSGGVLLAALGAAGAWAAARTARPKPERALAAFAAAVCLSHLALGRVGSMDRYQIYATSVGLLVLLYLQRAVLLDWVARGRSLPLAAVAAAGLIATAPHLYYGTFAALYSNEMYLQQFQMGRLARETFRAPVAVNDLGLVSYHNPFYVLDLWGLASREALGHRRARHSAVWMEALAAKHDVRAVMIYDSWFPVRPSAWVHIAELRLRRIRPGSGRQPVAIYARSEQAAASLRRDLTAFQELLPEGAWLAIP